MLGKDKGEEEALREESPSAHEMADGAHAASGHIPAGLGSG